MNLISNNSKKEVVRNGVVCPICGQTGDIERDDDEPYYVWCTNCRNWFEMGFQIHSGD